MALVLKRFSEEKEFAERDMKRLEPLYRQLFQMRDRLDRLASQFEGDNDVACVGDEGTTIHDHLIAAVAEIECIVQDNMVNE